MAAGKTMTFDPLVLLRALHDEKLGVERMADSAKVLNQIMRPLCLSKDACLAVESISSGCEHLLQAYRQLSESAAMRGLVRCRTVLTDLLQRTTREHMPMAMARGVRLVCRCPARPVVAEVDPLLIERLLNNLLSNAIKHSRRGDWVAVKLAQHSGEIELSIRDRGQGIPKSLLPNIFNPFVTGPESDGSGIGLSNVKHIAELHGGSVRCASRKGAGTLMTVRLPINKAQ